MADIDDGKRKFADYVRLHAVDQRFITREEEKRILQEGILRFGLDLAEANGILLAVSAEEKIALERVEEERIRRILARFARKGKAISRADFEQTAATYREFANGAVSEAEARRSVKRMMETEGYAPRRTRWLIGSKRWYRAI